MFFNIIILMIKPCNCSLFRAEYSKFLNAENLSTSSINNYFSDLSLFLTWLAKLYLNRSHFYKNNNLYFFLKKEDFIGYFTYLSKSRPFLSLKRNFYSLKKVLDYCLKRNHIEREIYDEALNELTLLFQSCKSQKYNDELLADFSLFLNTMTTEKLKQSHLADISEFIDG